MTWITTEKELVEFRDSNVFQYRQRKIGTFADMDVEKFTAVKLDDGKWEAAFEVYIDPFGIVQRRPKTVIIDFATIFKYYLRALKIANRAFDEYERNGDWEGITFANAEFKKV